MARTLVPVFVLALGALPGALLTPSPSEAMCTCMMGMRPPQPTAPEEQTALPSEATIAVLMREDTRTVLSFQNDYLGPPEDFALLVPVPTLLEREDVRTLDHGVFDRLQTLAAPKLVELWEQPPCQQGFGRPTAMRSRGVPGALAGAEGRFGDVSATPAPVAPVVERQFAQGEYDIQILSASDALGLERWLTQAGYQLPPGAAPILRSYVEQGMKWFVARVDSRRLANIHAARHGGTPASAPGGRMLSPLRFHYDSERFGLPVRLGLLNSPGTQDLVVHIVAPDVRYEVANYPTVEVPTNVTLADGTGAHFGRIYEAYFDKLTARHPGRVFTEYAGPLDGDVSAGLRCVGCGRDALSEADLDALGDDVLPGGNDAGRRRRMVLTRLRYRYDRRQLPDDLLFRPAAPLAGGHENGTASNLRHRGRSATRNAFGVRFLIEHPWEGSVACASPRRGVWGGRPPGLMGAAVLPLSDTARVPLQRWIRGSVPGLSGRRL